MMKTVSCMIVFFSSQLFADSLIRVDLKTNEKTAAAIGFLVDGKKSGSRGRLHSSTGPVNRKYTFGYRKNFALGRDIFCGTKTLTKNTKITLVTNGEQCLIITE